MTDAVIKQAVENALREIRATMLAPKSADAYQPTRFQCACYVLACEYFPDLLPIVDEIVERFSPGNSFCLYRKPEYRPKKE